MSDPIILGNFEAVHELTENDNFHTSIYESDYKGLLIARCNQNGKYPHQAMAILNGLNGKQASAELVAQYASRISQQDAELERVKREVEEAREALKPFAERAARFDDIPGIYRCNDNVELWQDGNWRCDLTVGDLRKARSAIAVISEAEETQT